MEGGILGSGNRRIIDFGEWSRRITDPKTSGFGDGLKKGFTKPRIILLVIIALLFIFFLIIAPFASFYTDALWYNQLGFESLFWKTLIAKIVSVLVFGAIFFAIIYTNIHVARKLTPEQRIDLAGSPLEGIVKLIQETWSRVVKIVVVVFCAVTAFFAGIGWGGKWELVLKFLNHTSFGKSDPIFQKDAGFYMFTFPFLRALASWLLGSVIFIFIITGLIYLLVGGIRFQRGSGIFAPKVKGHLSILLAAIFLIKAFMYRLDMYELLFNKEGAVYGIGYTDLKARIPAYWILFVLSILAAVVLLANVRYRGWILPMIAVGSLVIVTIIAGSIVPLIMQNYKVKPNERGLEAAYLKHNIDFTRVAYDINKVKRKPYPAEENLTMDLINKNRLTIDNVRLWDTRPMVDVCQQLQAIRQYYGFTDVDVDRYVIDGVYRQVMIAAREMVQANLPSAAKTWINQVLVYTHGYGVMVAPSNDVTGEGNPRFVLKDIPPRGETDLKLTRPEIYFGEQTSNYVVVGTTEDEFDYPVENKQVYTKYKGRGGVYVKGIWRRILFAIRFLDPNMLFSGQIKGDSQVLYFRDVRERVSRCAPFLKLDRDPYIVISDDGKLYWILDTYTTSDYFPYSEHTQGFGNYIRNSVKAVVDAYTGKVWLYVIDEKDPVIMTYRKIFPRIFTSFDKMPEGLRKHLRYPEDYFIIQANMLRTYHMTEPRQFYNKEDEWDFPKETYNEGAQEMVPYYLIMKLPDEPKEEMVLLLPFVPHKRENMISWFAARMDGDKYGELINFAFPAGKLIYGPEQIEGRIEQDPMISQQLSLWRQEGSQVIRGNLLVIPIEGSILYVEPLYLQAVQIRIPQIKRVILAYGQQVVMETTLERALERIFTGVPPDKTEEEKPKAADISELSQRAVEIYEKATEAQKAGNWAQYGEYLKQLGEVLKSLNEQAQKKK